MKDRIIIEESENENEMKSMWGKFKAQLHFWVLAFDYDPLDYTYEQAKSVNLEVQCLKSRIRALELQMCPSIE